MIEDGAEVENFPELQGLSETLVVYAIEESPLWEILWEINTRFPTRTEAERLSLAAQTVELLLQKRRVELVWARRGHDQGTEWKTASPSDREMILRDRRYWEPIAWSEWHIEVHATGGG